MTSLDQHERLRESLTDLGRAVDRLGEALSKGTNDSMAVDATIHRFEFTFELLWKTVRLALLADLEIEAVFPKLYAAGWIADEALWIEMLKSRNLTSHTYKEALAREIYDRIHGYYPEIRRLHTFLSDRFKLPT